MQPKMLLCGKFFMKFQNNAKQNTKNPKQKCSNQIQQIQNQLMSVKMNYLAQPCEKKFHVYAHLQASITNAVNNLCEFLSILKLFDEHRISN